jgi:hypothetical protein
MTQRAACFGPIVGLLALVLGGCETKTIQNLGAIDVGAQLSLEGLRVEIFLLTETGERLYWESGILGPTGERPLSPSEFDTKVELWSLRNGQRHVRVYAGRLGGLRWSVSGAYGYRSLVGLVPRYAIQDDPETDSLIGEMDVTLKTPKQGDFHQSAYDVPLYPAGYLR